MFLFLFVISLYPSCIPAVLDLISYLCSTCVPQAVGNKISYQYKRILLEGDDAKDLVPGEEITLMRWGNCIITQVNHDDFGNVTEVIGKLHLEGDFKATKKKITWVPDVVSRSWPSTPLFPSLTSVEQEDKVHVTMHEFDYLVSKAKLGEDEDFKDFVNPITEAVVSSEEVIFLYLFVR